FSIKLCIADFSDNGSNNSILVSPTLIKATFTCSLSTSSIFSKVIPSKFVYKGIDASTSRTAIPICAICFGAFVFGVIVLSSILPKKSYTCSFYHLTLKYIIDIALKGDLPLRKIKNQLQEENQNVKDE